MKKSNTAVQRIETGINGFDTMLCGGLPSGRSVLVAGSAGTGKTILLNEFLYRGITKYSQNGLFVTFEESPEDIIQNVGSFGWDYRILQKKDKLAFIDFSLANEMFEEVSPNYDLSPLLLRIKQGIHKTNARRVVIDSIGALFSQFSAEREIRRIIYRICLELKQMGITSMITTEQPFGEEKFSRYGVEEFVTDGVIQLKLKTGEQQFIREMSVVKMRGVNYRSGSVQFTIDSTGLRVYPKIEFGIQQAKTSFIKKIPIGITKLDKALSGGIPQGHIVLVSGNTGTGKTLMGMQFVEEGISKGEKAIYVALEEPAIQLKKTAEAHGWDFPGHEERGNLIFITANLIDFFSDKLLADIVEKTEENQAKRIVIDSISSIMSATMDQEKVRQFLLQLASFLKSKGVTSILSYLMPSNFGAVKDQLMSSLQTNLMRLSSVVDGVILLQYVEREQKVEKMLNILKMRGSSHNREIIKYEIKKGGFVIGERFKL